MHIIPYTITPFLTYLLFLHMYTPKKEFIPAAHHAPSLHNDEWKAACIKTIFNHPAVEETITFVIEYTQSLQSHLETPIKLNTPWSPELFVSLLYDPIIHKKIIRISNTGLILGWNAVWHTPKTTLYEYTTLDLHTYYTQITDALVCIVNPKNRTCILIHQGIIHPPKNISETIHYLCTLSQSTHAKESHVFKQEKTNSSHPIS